MECRMQACPFNVNFLVLTLDSALCETIMRAFIMYVIARKFFLMHSLNDSVRHFFVFCNLAVYGNLKSPEEQTRSPMHIIKVPTQAI